MTGKRLLYAPNIHQGGGRTLLLPLLEALKDDVDVTFVLDARMRLPTDFRLAGDVYRVEATLCSRLSFELRLCKLIRADSLLLCMGNLPPLFAHQGIQHIFVQNRYLVDDVSLNAFPLSVRVRLVIERWWLKSRVRYVKRIAVQTPTMQRLLYKCLGYKADILPFVNLLGIKDKQNKSGQNKRYDFVYVASGEPHKKHRELIDGWVELAKQGLFPSLCLTLNDIHFPELCARIQSIQQRYDLHIDMKGELTYDEVQGIYFVSKAIVYPSEFEAFGVPLLEAAALSLPILTVDADYVYDVIKPTAVFDVDSPASIADAVINMSDTPAEIVTQLLSAEAFVKAMFDNSILENDS